MRGSVRVRESEKARERGEQGWREREREANRVKNQFKPLQRLLYRKLTMGNVSVGCCVDGWDAPSHRFLLLLMGHTSRVHPVSFQLSRYRVDLSAGPFP